MREGAMNMRKRGVQLAAMAALGLLWVTAGVGESNKLKGVEVIGAGDAARLVLDVTGSVTHRAFTLGNPDRLVVDLVGVVTAVKNPVATPETGPVARVRVSQFQGGPNPVVRVVADLRSKLPYEVTSQDEDLIVVLGDAPAGDVSASTSAKKTTAGTPSGASVEDFAAFTAVAQDAAATPAPVQAETAPVVSTLQDGSSPAPAAPVTSLGAGAANAPVVGTVPPDAVATPVIEASAALPGTVGQALATPVAEETYGHVGP